MFKFIYTSHNLFNNQGSKTNKNDICTFRHTIFYENFRPTLLYSLSLYIYIYTHLYIHISIYTYIYICYINYFSGKRQRKSTKDVSKTCHWKLIFVIWSYSAWALRHSRHVSTQGTWARKHARHVGTWAHKHARHVGTWARKASNLADPIILHYFGLP